jgi:DNA polymerase-1
MTTPLILVDGSSFLFRAYHALPVLNNKKGEPTHAILGVSNMLRKLLADYHPAYMAVVFDGPAKTFRHELSADYKANRTVMPDDLRCQIQPLYALIQAMGLPLIVATGVEADDVLGCLARYAAQQGHDVIIATSDKDMAQLVNEAITLEDTMSRTKLTINGVIAKFGVRPDQIADYLALVGDSSDNIAGVPKVGAKTAAKWLAEYDTLDNLIAHAHDISGKVGALLRENLPQLQLAKQLTQIRCDLALPYQMDDLKRLIPDDTQLKAHLTDLEFSSWLKTLSQHQTQHQSDSDPEQSVEPSNQPTTTATANYSVILTIDDLEVWLSRLAEAPLFAIDTETTSLDYTQARLVGISFAVHAHEAAYLPLTHEYSNAPAQLNFEQALDKLRPLLENAQKLKVGQNLKYDYHVFANHGITLRGIAHDTMIASYVLNSTQKHGLDALAQHYLNLETIQYQDVTGKGAKQIGFAQVPIEIATRYAAEDADICLQLHHLLLPKLQQEPALLALYTELEIPFLTVLARLERNGVLIDDTLLDQQGIELAQQLIQLEHQAHNVAAQPFNLNSPKQIQSILYDQLQLPVLKRTPKGQPSTDESVLQELAADYELPNLILEHRSLSKLKSTYVDKLPEQINPLTGRVHTSYHQTVTATGRLSSSDPNLQNIPIRSAEGRKIRQAFKAPQGFSIVAADYSQIELRIMAHLSDDDGLIAAFQQNQDIHKATAADVFHVPINDVSVELRRSAKAINFGLIYGMSSFGLAKQLNISRNDAQQYIDAYFTRYPRVKDYMNDTKALAIQQGYVETLFGRRLYLPDIQSRNATLRQYAERTAINAPMQGTAADIIKRAMLSVDQWLEATPTYGQMLMQVHDELVFEIKNDHLESAIAQIRMRMSDAAKLKVPLIVDVNYGNNWDEAH